MEYADKTQINPESVDYNQVVSELLTISSHNITEIPGMLQSKDAPRDSEPTKVNLQPIPREVIVPEAKPAYLVPVEPKAKVEDPPQQQNFSSYCMSFHMLP